MEIIEELHLRVLSFVITRPTGENANSQPLQTASRCEQPSAAKNATEKCKRKKKKITIAITVTKQKHTKRQYKRERKLLQYKNRQNPKREKFTRQSKCKLMSKITI